MGKLSTAAACWRRRCAETRHRRGSRRALGDLILFFWPNRLKFKPVAIENINTSYNPIFVLLWSLLFLLTWLLVARQLTISRPGPRPGSGESRDKCTMIYSIVFLCDSGCSAGVKCSTQFIVRVCILNKTGRRLFPPIFPSCNVAWRGGPTSSRQVGGGPGQLPEYKKKLPHPRRHSKLRCHRAST